MNDPQSCCTRREAMKFAFGGAGSLLAAGLLHEMCAADEARGASADPLAPKAPHFPAKAKRVIFLFHTGGVSHVDSFDPKPKLFADHGKTVTIDEWQGKPGKYNRYLKKPQWDFKPRGKSGIEVSSLFPHMGDCVDDLCVIRSLQSDHTNHYEATLMMHTGSITFARPSIGAWMSYGLGTVNRNLPSFLVLAPAVPYAGDQTWGTDFLPGCHQGTRVVPGPTPIADLARRTASAGLQDLEREMLQQCNQEHLDHRAGDAGLTARVRSFETAYGMQKEAPEAFDLAKESDATLQLYGLQRGANTGFAWQCLVARRMAERGVRFIELIDVGSSNNWDAHADMLAHAPLAKNVDQAIAGLITDLKQRGMLDDTLVVWCTEFGRTPYNEQADAKGREHHHWAFSGWLAGGGVKRGLAYGSTDEYGIHVAENPVHVHDFHATILHLMGLDHEKLTYRHAGRDFRLTDVSGRVVKEILA
ncbi:MAG TPA: DUF1501 domain-containing protein [Planctomycetales bacterium]|jgi:hypothetical protein|nr:DUF1501 domain-containing protein [Planctomycetales bacterium]